MRSPRTTVTALAVVAVAHLCVSCGTPPAVDQEGDGAGDPAATAIEPPAAPTKDGATTSAPDPLAGVLDRAIAQQATRLQRLRLFESVGTVTVRWTEGRSTKTEQCDLDLYVGLPDRTAFNLKKLGTRYAWIGSSGSRWWVFDLASDTTKVDVHSWTTPESDEEPAPLRLDRERGTGFSLVSPRAIMALAGLAPLERRPTTTVREQAANGPIIVETPADPAKGEPGMRWTLDRFTLLPNSIELFDERGDVFVVGSLREYRSVDVPGLAPGDHPKLPGYIDVRRSDGSGSIGISLERPTARIERMKDRYFDLDALLREFKPKESVWHERGMGAGTGARR
jgi:hypothetical protein